MSKSPIYTKEYTLRQIESSLSYISAGHSTLSYESTCRELSQMQPVTASYYVGELENCASKTRDVFPIGPSEKRNKLVIWLIKRGLIVPNGTLGSVPPRINGVFKCFVATERGKAVLDFAIMHDILPFFDKG